MNRRLTFVTLFGALCLARPVLADDDAPAKDASQDADEPAELDPDAGIARPDAPDLRSGHVVIRAGGGVWVPSKPFAPAIDELGDLNVGGAFHGQVGIGLNRYLVLAATGGLALIPSANTDCDGCGATSVDAAIGLEFHVNQGFAFDPWVGYGMGYRHSILGLAAQDDVTLDAFEFMRLTFAGDYFPASSFGLGPYIEVDVGVRQFSDAVFYGVFQSGLRLTFDPMAIGTSFVPGEQTARR